MKRRKVTFKLYPSKEQERTLYEWLELHRGIYNDALAERRDAYRAEGRSVTFREQIADLPGFKAAHPELKALGSHALQETLRRLDRAFASFFRRVKAGENKPGYPRFKGKGRLKSFTYPDPAGWRLLESTEGRTHRLRISNLGEMRVRGKHRFPEGSYQPNALTVMRRGRKWYASITLRVSEEGCSRERVGDDERGLDLGLASLVTFDNGEVIDNPRWMRGELEGLRGLQRQRSRKAKGSRRYRRLSAAIARTHERIENRRADFLHKLSARLVRENRLLATEALSVKQMSAKGKRKNGLNREILSAGWATLLTMLAAKAEEAGSRLHVADTRTLKPSQRCSGCGAVRKKPLYERRHVCPCGASLGRDENAARVCLADARGEIDTASPYPGPGTGLSAREYPLDDSYEPSKVSSGDPRNRQLKPTKV